jgi:fumarylacetoacetase
MIDRTHNKSLRSWVESANRHGADFPIQNLPFATFRTADNEEPRVGVAIGDSVLDVTRAFGVKAMQDYMAATKSDRVALRRSISDFLATRKPGAQAFLTQMDAVELMMPCPIGGYTDFYSSIHHAANVGSMFRPGNPLLPNYKWLPVAYHGRVSTIVLSGTPVRRPRGQVIDAPGSPPVYRPTASLDYEIEIGAFLGPGNQMGEPIPAGTAANHIVGLCLLNDWSARDIQTWEYQPLGPFLAKNFATSISPWIVTAEALEPFQCPPDPRPESDPQPLPHLDGRSNEAFRIVLEVWLRTAAMTEPVKLSSSLFDSMYWTLAQMVTHHASNGCRIAPGDLIGSGTVSGPTKDSRGCLLELAWRGAEPVELPNGETRSFLQDGDEVIFRAWCETSTYQRIGFGECRGVVLPAVDPVQDSGGEDPMKEILSAMARFNSSDTS